MDIDTLQETDLAEIADLIARQHQAARTHAPTLPTELDDPVNAEQQLRHLLAAGHQGYTARRTGTIVGVLIGTSDGAYASMPAEGFAIDPAVRDATQVLAEMYAPLATEFVATGVLRHYLDHVATPALIEAVADMGFGRHHYFAVRSTDQTPSATGQDEITIRLGTTDDLQTIAELCIVEIRFRSSAPVFSPPENPSLDDVIEAHRMLHDTGATHFIASLGDRDVGVLTLENCQGMPALCAIGQPFIGETGTLEAARGRGVGTALVDAAIAWSARHEHPWISVDFQPPNPLSRRFWLGARFIPTGYGVVRAIHPSHGPT